MKDRVILNISKTCLSSNVIKFGTADKTKLLTEQNISSLNANCQDCKDTISLGNKSSFFFKLRCEYL